MRLRISDDHPVPTGRHSLRMLAEFGGRLPSRTGRVFFLDLPDDREVTLGAGDVLSAMNLGDSVFFPVPRDEEKKHRNRLLSASVRRGRDIVTRAGVEDRIYGLRIWRIS